MHIFKNWELADLLERVKFKINENLKQQHYVEVLQFAAIAPHSSKKLKPPSTPKYIL